jgi:uncharacterized protein YndB with AHSA1/START domain
MTGPAIPAVEKELKVACSPEAAFNAFTQEFAAWWPSATHSLGAPDRVERVVFECRHGGSIYELWHDGSRRDWGRVVEWDPPRSVAFTWHVGRSVEEASFVTLSFAADGAGTAVRLVHRGWEALGDAAREARDSYDAGWGRVFGSHYFAYVTSRARPVQ